ncbi:histone-lysine N-methyltransferase SETMAR [Trichonephila clavipes]|nr:histone-lysine N-methyltransferase SETMAR [Trichonephila clavipes]
MRSVTGSVRASANPLRSSVLLLDDKARPHSATAMHNHFATLNWKRLHHPPYNPNLATSYFHLFQALKKNLARRHFESNAEIKQAIERIFRMQSPEIFLQSFLKLFNRNRKDIEKRVQRNPRDSMRQITRDMRKRDRLVRRISNTELGLKPYKLKMKKTNSCGSEDAENF